MKKLNDFSHVMMMVSILAFAWMCGYSDWLYDVVSYDMYYIISWLVIWSTIGSAVMVIITWMTSKIIERRKVKELVDPFTV